MKKVVAVVIFISSVLLTRAQVPVFQWAKRMGGTGFDAARSIAVDNASGAVYTTGAFQGTVDFDPGAGTLNLTSAGSNDMFISKLDALGNFLWAKNIGGTLDENGSCIQLDASGNIYVVGSFGGTVDFDPNGGVVNLTSAGSDDAYILKLDASGSFLWVKSVGGTGAENATSVSIDASGNVCVIGDFAATGDFDPGAGVASLTSIGSNDSFILKLDASGNYMWAKRFGDVGYDTGRSITTDASGNIYATGAFQGTADFDPGAGVVNLISAGNNDIFVLKLDASGNYVWAKNMGGTSYDSGAFILTDGSGNVYTIGDLQGTGDFDPGAGTANLTAASNDVFLSKLDASGNYVWAKSWGGGGVDYGISIAMDAANNLYSTGYFFGTVDFDPGAGTTNLVSYGGYDAYISKLDPSGNFVWAKQLGGTINDYGYAIKVDASSDSIYTAGFFNATADFDPGTGTFNLSAAGAADVFVHKMRVCTVPLAPTNITPVANQLICANSTASLSATGVGTVRWYSTSTATLALGSGTTYITPTLSIGTYTYYAEALTCSTGSIRTPVTVTVNAGSVVTINSSTICLGQQTATLIANGASTYTWMPVTSLSAGTGSIVMATPNINQTYTVISTSTGGCISTSTTIVTVNQLPVLTTNTAAICLGQQTATLIVSGASSYTWSPSLGLSSSTGSIVTANPISAQNYTVIAVDANGCTNSVTTTVTVRSLPTITVTGGVICAGQQSATLTASGASTYSWMPSTGLSSTTGAVVTGTPASSQNYTIAGADVNGCVNTTTTTVTVTSGSTITVNSATICVGQQTATLTASGASAYSWSPATGLSSTLGSSVTGTLGTTTNYTVFGTNSSGCVSTVTTSIIVNTPAIITVSSATICVGQQTAILIAQGSDNYTWSPSLGLSSTTGSVVTANPTSTQNYTITAIDMNGCSSNVTTTITVKSLPVLAVIGGTICSGQQSATLTANGASTYTWMPATDLSSTTGAVVTGTPASSQNYTIAGTDANGCVNTATTTISVVSNPTVTVTSATICAGQQTATLTANGASTYSWSPAIGLTSTLGSIVTGTPGTTTSYTVFGTNSNGCVRTATTNIIVNTLPIITVSNASICIGQQTATLTVTGAITYTWIPSTGLSSSIGSLVTGNPGSTQSYTVFGINASGCIGGTVTTIVVNPLPIIAVNQSTICVGQQSATLTASGAYTYTWMPGTGLSSTTGSLVMGAPTSNQNYTVVGTNSNGCVNTKTTSIRIVPAPTITVNSATICAGQQTAQLTVTGITSGTFNWAPATDLTPTTGTMVVSSTTLTQTYTVVNTNANGCISTATAIVFVNPLPVIYATDDTLILLGQSAPISVIGGLSYTWLPNDGSIACASCSNTMVQPTVTTEYIVIGYDSLNCWQQDTVLVRVDVICGDFFIPNVFSPNGDGLNDGINVHGICIASYNLQIFDRWGEKVFETTSKTESWDGSYKGKPMDTGVFVYKVVGTTIENKSFTMKGNVTLLR